MASSSPSALIVRLDAIGDALALTPAIAALRECGIRVAVVLSAVNAGVFSARALEDRYVATFAQRDDSPRNRSAIWEFAEALRAHYTHALIATEDPAGYRLAYDAEIPSRTGFENGWGKPFKTLWVRRLCTRTVYRSAGLDANTPHECEVIFRLAAPLLSEGAQPTRDVRTLRPLILDEEPLPDSRIVLQITDKWERLGQRFDSLLELALHIARNHDVRCIASASEESFADRFETAAHLEVERFETLASWKSAIGAARAYIGPDSGGIHLAGMVGTPVVAAYAPGNTFGAQTARWSPWASPHRIVKMEDQWPVIAADAVDDVLSSRGAYTG